MSPDERAERLRNLSPAQRQQLLRLLREKQAPRENGTRIRPLADPGPFLLSFAQQRLWFLDLLAPGSPAYNVPHALFLEGDLEPAVLARALSEVVRRHCILRARFTEREGRPVQEICPPAPLALPVADLGGLPPGAAAPEVRRLAAVEARRPFDLVTGPPLRVWLLRRSASDHLLLLTLHHIVADGWSIANFSREVSALYAAFLAGGRSPLPPLPIQYTDYAAWQQQRLSGETLERHLAYWREQLAGAPAVLELPTDRPRPAIQSFRGATIQVILPLSLTRPLRRVVQQSETTLFTVLLAAFQVLLARYSGQNDIVVGAPVANRARPELEPLIGLFVNTLALRCELMEDETFRRFHARVAATTLSAHDHQELPFEKLVEELELPRALSHSPLVQVLFALQNVPREAAGEGRGLRLSQLVVDSRTAQLDLNLSLAESGDTIAGGLQYSTDLFDDPTIERLFGHFASLLASVAADPEIRLSEIPLLSIAERHQLVAEWNATDVSFSSGGATLPELLRQQVDRTPEAFAIAFADNALTYRELDSRAWQLAATLREAGVGPEVLVALCAERSLELVVALVGILYAGGAYVPLDPAYPAARLAFMLEDSGARVLLAQPHLMTALPPFTGPVVTLAEETGVAGGGQLPALLPDNLAYVIYTSGSTGKPKGVMNTHRGIVNRLLWMQQAFRLDAGDRVLQKTSASFDVSVWELFWPLLTGAGMVLARPGGHRESDYLVNLIAAAGITTLHFVPSMLRAFLEEPDIGLLGGSALRRVMVSGEALSADLQDLFSARLGVELHNLYGPTEAAVDVTWWSCTGPSGGRAVPIGRPISNLRILLLDRCGQLVPAGVPGELHIGGVGLARGYWERPGLTAARFIPDGWGRLPGGRLYRSGDLARWRADGAIDFLGRTDHQVKVRGFRIELGEIEAALTRHPGVREAAVVTREDHGVTRLVAYFAGHDGRIPAAEELRVFLAAGLPEFMVPSFFVEMVALPLSPSGKLDRHALPAPQPQTASQPGGSAPRTPAEELLCAIWQQVLGVDPVGVHDNFFALGGDSILSLRVISLARTRGLEIALPDLFRYQTIAALAGACASRVFAEPSRSLTAPFDLATASDRALLPEDVEDAYPLAMLQLGMLYHMEQTPEEPLYHNVDSWHLRGTFVAAPFREAVRRVVARHPMLRTSFHLTGFSEPLQLVHREADLPVSVSDIQHLPDAEQEHWIDGLIANEKRSQFDFTRAPQTRFLVALRSASTFQFTLVENHAIFDGWSMHSTLAEIFEAYFGLLAGREMPEKPPLELSYRDFVALEKQVLAAPEAEAFWVEKLAGFTPVELPRWPVRGEPSGLRMRSVQRPVPGEVYAGLKRLAREAAVPLKSTTLAAHLKVLSLLTGSSDIVTGVAANGRLEQADGDQVRGLFLNTLPFRFSIADGTWLELVQDVFAEERRFLPFRRYPLAALRRRWNDRVLFDIAFNYIHFHVVGGLMRSGELEVLSARGSEGTNFKLLAHFEQDPNARSMVLEIEYDSREVPREQVLSMSDLYLRALRAMTVEAGRRHGEACLLAEAELHAVLHEWNDSAAGAAPRRDTIELFAEWVARAPEAPAVEAVEARLTYGELGEEVHRLAGRLRRLRVGADTRVVIFLERSPQMIVAILAVLAAGGGYVLLDPTHPRERLDLIMRDALDGAAPVAITRADLAARLPAPAGAILVQLDGDDHPAVRASATLLNLPPEPAALAYVIYTSGSIGTPKGVVVSRGGLANYLAHCRAAYGFAAGWRVPLCAPPIFDLAITSLLAPLTAGAVVRILPDGGEGIQELAENLRRRESLDLLKLTPTHLRALAQLGCAIHFLPEHGSEAGPLPIGRPIANVRVLVLDSAGRPLPRDVVGELCVGGDGLARGYLGRPDLTAERFIPDPFPRSAGERLYRTGDLARRRSDGELEYLGRADRQIKLRGDRLPEAASGKIDRRNLVERTLASAPRGVDGFVAPRGEKEEVLAGIWRSLLRVEQVSVHDNFFALGGDSILSLQVASRARKAGLRLSSRQVLAHPTIAELASSMVALPATAAEVRPLGATVPLTPIQRWFFEQDLPHREHFNQAVLLEVGDLPVPRQRQAGVLAHAFEHLVAHHEALSFRFVPAAGEPGGWHQLARPSEGSLAAGLAVVDLSALTPPLRTAAVNSVAGQLQSSLDLAAGPLWRSALFELGRGEPQRLLVIVHHLVVDGYSWRILLEDLTTLGRQLAAGEAPVLSGAVSFQRWAERLCDPMRSQEAVSRAGYWLRCSDRLESPPDAACEGAGTMASRRTLPVSLAEEETRALLQVVPRAYGTRINDVLLTALAAALRIWMGNSLHQIDLEGHGREEIFDDLDLSRTVGWLTSLFPVVLDLDGVEGPAESLKAIKEQLRALPDQGLSFGLARYLGEGAAADSLRALPRSRVLFNYLGQVEEASAREGLFRLLGGGVGPLRHPRQPRSHPIEIEAVVHGGRLHVHFVYSADRHEQATIASLAESFVASLRDLIAHCLSREARAFTPSDFPLAGLGQRALDDLTASLTADLEDLYPLSPAQHGMLFHTLEAARPGVYVNQITVILEAELDIDGFERAWADMIARHPILRTAFLWEKLEEPLQAVLGGIRPTWERQDWRGLPEEALNRRLRTWLGADRQRGFDPAKAPLVRLALLRLGEQRYQFIWTFHHLLLDGWSMAILLRELFVLYEAGRSGGEVRLERIRPFRDYISWLRRQSGKAAEEHWRRTLAGFTEPTPLGVDRAVAGLASDAEPVVAERLLAAPTTERLRTFARARELTLNSLLQGVWALLLARNGGARDVVFGTTLSGRSAPIQGIESMVGMFINTLPIRVEVDPAARLGSWLDGLQRRQTEMLQHEHSSLSAVRGWSKVPHGLPLFESTLVFENYPIDNTVRERVGATFAIGGVRAIEQTNYPLTLVVSPAAAALSLQIAYDGGRLDAATVHRMLGHLAELFARIPAAGDARLGDVEMLSSAELEELRAWAAGARLEAAGNIAERFAAQAARSPERAALIWQGDALSYGELAARAHRLAHCLRQAGVGGESPVALLLERSAAAVVAILAISAAGGSWVPLSPDHPMERLAFILEDTAARLVVTESRWLGVLPALPASVRVMCLDREAGQIARQPATRPAVEVPQGALAYTIYTSGSTGRPKGVQVEHRSAVHLLAGLETLAPRLRLGPLRATLNAPLIFDASVQQLMLLLAGHTLCLVPEELRTEPAALLAFLRRERVDLLDCTPSLLSALVDAGLLAGESPSLVFAAGEAIDGVLWETLRGAADRDLYNIYGPTECTVDATGHRIGSAAGGPTIGRPLANYETYLLGADLRAVPPGAPGELCVGGCGLARGYLGRADLTSERFVPHPFSAVQGARLYRTGDLARYRPDGELEFLGRSDQQVKVRGYRIEPGEIETALRLHPWVREAVVAVLRRRTDGEESAILVSWVQPAPAAPAAAELAAGLLHHLRRSLPSYMVPAAVVPLSVLPLTASGKIDRRALAATTLASSPAEARARTWAEELVAAIFAEVLRLEFVDPDAGFFALGGHSLLATRLLSRLRAAFGIELPMRALFEAPSVAALAADIEAALLRGAATSLPDIVRAPDRGALPLSFAQQRLWLVDQIDPGNPAYNVPVALRLIGHLDEAALAAGLAEIVRRHEILRMTFGEIDGQPVQWAAPPQPLALPRVDLSGLPSVERSRERRRLARAESAARFSLRGACPWRIALLRLAEDESMLLITLHHILCDGWSMGVLIRELGALYAAGAAGRPSPLPELPVQYADFAVWQRGWMQGEQLDRLVAWWTARLAGAPRFLELPGARPRAAGPGRAGHCQRRLDTALARGFEACGRHESATLFMALLAAFAALLHAETGSVDLVVGTDVAQRDRAEIEPLVGFFVNQLALRVDLSGNPSFRDLLARAREAALGAYTHQDLPFEKLVEELKVPRSAGQTPLFQVKLALQDLPRERLHLPGIELASEESERPTTHLDLNLRVFPVDGEVVLSLQHDAVLYDGPSMERLLALFEEVLRRVTADPELRLDRLVAALQEADRSRRGERERGRRESRRELLQKLQGRTALAERP